MQPSLTTTHRNTVGWFAATIFTSAFLLFQVQPLIGKFILPWYGGSPAVWTTCMLVFQVLLFAGYAYAHGVSMWLTVRQQALLHSVLLVTAAVAMPITPSLAWKPTGSESPTLSIVILLVRTVGLPYFLLSSTGPLLQRWFCWTCPGRVPYRLYALSNVGSLLALLSYPFVFEPILCSSSQAWLWSVVFCCFAALCLVCAVWAVQPLQGGACHGQPATASVAGVTAACSRQLPLAEYLTWFCLAGLPSIMLLATTNQVCMDIAVIPFLWIVPLTIYLLSFIVTFDSDRWYRRRPTVMLCAISSAGTAMMATHGVGLPLLVQISVFFINLFFVCFFCHGELARRKPATNQLTAFYLTIAAGGAAGGLFVGLLAPYLFQGYYELNLGIVGCILLCLGNYLHEDHRWRERVPYRVKAGLGFLVLGAALVVCMTLAGHEPGTLVATRNFYGILRVKDQADDHSKDKIRKLVHGRIVHGSQFLSAAGRRQATTYYAPDSGVGRALRQHQINQPREIGVVGLGAGTLAVYGRAGDHMRFYEINPEVIRLANEHFWYLSDCPAEVTVVLGDARLTLEQEEARDFDLLVLDAFSGDAIPVHLLTAEAMQLYTRHLAADGILAIHISNLHFDLQPVVQGLADQFGFIARSCENNPVDYPGAFRSLWMLLGRDASTVNAIGGERREHRNAETAHPVDGRAKQFAVDPAVSAIAEVTCSLNIKADVPDHCVSDSLQTARKRPFA